MNQSVVPEYFYQRFDEKGCIKNPFWPRITSETTEASFEERDSGLRVLLINAPIREWSYPNILPLGQSYMGSIVKMDGHKPLVLDLNAERKEPVKEDPNLFIKRVKERIIQKLKDDMPNVIGLGGIISQYSWIKRIAVICKDLFPDVPVVLGGGIASCMPEFMVKHLPVDVAVREEGEITFSEVLYRIKTGMSFKGVKGVVWREYDRFGDYTIQDNGPRSSIATLQQGLDFIPWPLRSAWPEDEVYKVNPIGHLNWQTKWTDGAPTKKDQYSLTMVASRGCPYGAKGCDYCYATYLGRLYRLRSPKEVVDEMQYLVEHYQASYIHFLDDLLLTNYHWALKLFQELRSRKKMSGFEVMWGGTCRTNIIADDVLRAKKENRPHMLEQAYDVGMRQAGYGIESASPIILKNVDKSGQTMEKMEIAIRETKRVMGYADCSFMIGSPGETEETVKETVDFCKRVGLSPEVFFFTTAYPGTTFWERALEEGLITKAVTGKKGEVDEDIIEKYFLNLGEQGEEMRTNFSDLPDQKIIDLSWQAINDLGAQNIVRHPHTADNQKKKKAVRGANKADL